MLRGIDALSSAAVVGGLLATGLVAGSLEASADAAPAAAPAAKTVTLGPTREAPRPRPTKTVVRVIRVTETPQVQQPSTGAASSWRPSGTTVHSSSRTPASHRASQPRSTPQPKPTATTSGS